MDTWKVTAVVTVLNFVRDSANGDVKEPRRLFLTVVNTVVLVHCGTHFCLSR